MESTNEIDQFDVDSMEEDHKALTKQVCVLGKHNHALQSEMRDLSNRNHTLQYENEKLQSVISNNMKNGDNQRWKSDPISSSGSSTNSESKDLSDLLRQTLLYDLNEGGVVQQDISPPHALPGPPVDTTPSNIGRLGELRHNDRIWVRHGNLRSPLNIRVLNIRVINFIVTEENIQGTLTFQEEVMQAPTRWGLLETMEIFSDPLTATTQIQVGGIIYYEVMKSDSVFEALKLSHFKQPKLCDDEVCKTLKMIKDNVDDDDDELVPTFTFPIRMEFESDLQMTLCKSNSRRCTFVKDNPPTRMILFNSIFTDDENNFIELVNERKGNSEFYMTSATRDSAEMYYNIEFSKPQRFKLSFKFLFLLGPISATSFDCTYYFDSIDQLRNCRVNHYDDSLQSLLPLHFRDLDGSPAKSLLSHKPYKNRRKGTTGACLLWASLKTANRDLKSEYPENDIDRLRDHFRYILNHVSKSNIKGCLTQMKLSLSHSKTPEEKLPSKKWKEIVDNEMEKWGDALEKVRWHEFEYACALKNIKHQDVFESFFNYEGSTEEEPCLAFFKDLKISENVTQIKIESTSKNKGTKRALAK